MFRRLAHAFREAEYFEQACPLVVVPQTGERIDSVEARALPLRLRDDTPCPRVGVKTVGSGIAVERDAGLRHVIDLAGRAVPRQIELDSGDTDDLRPSRDFRFVEGPVFQGADKGPAHCFGLVEGLAGEGEDIDLQQGVLAGDHRLNLLAAGLGMPVSLTGREGEALWRRRRPSP